ncbi:MAG: hypothetical protein ACOVRM_02525 [Planctomycetaceae bacterium]
MREPGREDDPEHGGCVRQQQRVVAWHDHLVRAARAGRQLWPGRLLEVRG